MMSLELRINNMIIGVAYIVNTMAEDRGKTIYNVSYFRPDRIQEFFKFSVKHKREEGAEKLALKVYETLGKELDKLNKKSAKRSPRGRS